MNRLLKVPKLITIQLCVTIWINQYICTIVIAMFNKSWDDVIMYIFAFLSTPYIFFAGKCMHIDGIHFMCNNCTWLKHEILKNNPVIYNKNKYKIYVLYIAYLESKLFYFLAGNTFYLVNIPGCDGDWLNDTGFL